VFWCSADWRVAAQSDQSDAFVCNSLTLTKALQNCPAMSAQPTPVRPGPERRSSTAPKRTSMLPKPSSIALDPSVLIAQHAQITGMHPITLGPNTILHPHSKISSALAPVVLGEGVVVYERAKVGLGVGPDVDAESRRSSMASARSSATIRNDGTLLGKNVVVESNAIVEAAEVGEGSVIEVGAVLGRGCVLGRVNVLRLHNYHHVLTRTSTVPSRRPPLSLQIRASRTLPLCIAAPYCGPTRPFSCVLRYSRQRWQFMQSSSTCSRSLFRTTSPSGRHRPV
jgi:dynactin-6